MEQLYRQQGTDELVSAAKMAAFYASKQSRLYHEVFLRYRNDIIHEGLVNIYATPNIAPFVAARRASVTFIKRQVMKQGMSGDMHWFKGGLKTTPASHGIWQDATEPTEGLTVSLKTMAKFFYALLDKKGKRGQKSAVLKAYIILERLEGRRLQALADETGHSLLNIKEHYKNAKALIRKFAFDNFDKMADWQREIALDCFFSGDDKDIAPMSRDEIKALRGEKSQEQFASELGVSFFTLRNWEYGDCSPSAKNLSKLWKYKEEQENV